MTKTHKKRKAKNKLFRILLFCILLLFVFRMRYLIKNSVSALSLLRTNEVYSEEDSANGIHFGASKSGNSAKPVLYHGKSLDHKLQKLSKSSSSYRYFYENQKNYPDALLSGICNNSDMIPFVKDYPKNRHKVLGNFTNKEINAKYPLLIQWDKRWGYADYGSSCLGISGCAPTCMSMVCLMLTKNSDDTPDVIGKYAMDADYYLENTGTQWSFLTEGADHFGIHGAELSLSRDTVMNSLEEGHPIICSVRPGDFTATGHFIVLAGIEDGKIIVLDPNSIKRSHKLWTYDCLEPQIKNLWNYTT